MAKRPVNPVDPWEMFSVSIRHAAVYPCAPDWAIAPAVLAYDDLFYVVKGIGWMMREDQRLDARPGDLFVLRAGGRYSAGHDPQQPLTVLSTGFYARGPGDIEALRHLPLPDRLRLPVPNRRAVQERFELLIADHKNPSRSGRLAARGALLRLLAETFRLIDMLPASRQAGLVAPPPGGGTRLATVQDYIDAHLNEPLTLRGLARVVHLSPTHFATMFRRYTGQSPMAYVRTRRMERAKGLLAGGDRTVEQIARDVGYEDPFYFSRFFRRLAGVPPSAYRASFESPFFR